MTRTRHVIVDVGGWRRHARGWLGDVVEGEDTLVEEDVPGRDDAAGGEVVAAVPAVIHWISDEDTRR